MAETFSQKLTSDLDHVLMSRLQKYIDGTISVENADLKMVDRLDHYLVALRDVLTSTIATTGKAKAALEARLGAKATIGPSDPTHCRSVSV
jgi:hypothetical protein